MRRAAAAPAALAPSPSVIRGASIATLGGRFSSKRRTGQRTARPWWRRRTAQHPSTASRASQTGCSAPTPLAAPRAERMVTETVAVRPRSSVIVSVTPIERNEGTTRVAIEVLALISWSLVAGSVTHCQATIEWPLAAVLALPSSLMRCPGEPVVLEGVIWTNMPAAATTAAAALTMPAPQVAVVQTHSAGVLGSVKLPLVSVVRLAAWHCVLVVDEEVGNASALDCRRARTCAGVSAEFIASISAAMPETIGVA